MNVSGSSFACMSYKGSCLEAGEYEKIFLLLSLTTLCELRLSKPEIN